MHVQRLAGKREVRLAKRLGLGWMRVDQLGDLGWQRLPVVNELAFGDELTDPAAHQMDAKHRAAEGQLIYNWEALPSEVAQLIHPHPTQSEALGEAHLALAGKPLHVHG